VIAAFLIPDAGCAERPRVLLADDHPAVLALTAPYWPTNVWWSEE